MCYAPPNRRTIIVQNEKAAHLFGARPVLVQELCGLFADRREQLRRSYQLTHAVGLRLFEDIAALGPAVQGVDVELGAVRPHIPGDLER